MWIAISLVAVAVLVAAAFMGLGKFGEMPTEPVTDRPKGRVPDGPVTDDLLSQLRIARVITGYDPEQVDSYLAEIASGTAVDHEQMRFDVVRGGYDMQMVDELIERPRTGLGGPTSESDAAFTRPDLTPQPGTDLEDAE